MKEVPGKESLKAERAKVGPGTGTVSTAPQALPPQSLEPQALPPQALPPQKADVPKKVIPPKEERDLDYFMEEMKKRVKSYHEQNSSAEVKGKSALFKPDRQAERIRETVMPYRTEKEEEQPAPKQLDLFEEKFLDRKAEAEYKLIGQVFDTYWLVEYHDNLYIIDQHAAHERV